MNTRKIVRQIHLWVGLVSGVIISVVGLSGAIYLFQPEAHSIMYEEYLIPSGEGEPMTAKELTQSVEDRFEEKSVQSIQWPNRERKTFMYKFFEDPNWHYFDQYTGNYLGSPPASHFYNVIYDIHTTLTVGTVGRYITGTASLLLALVLISSGLFLWLPRRLSRLKKSFSIKWSGKGLRVNYDLHNVLGFYFAIPMFLIAITGAYMTFPSEIENVVNTITFSKDKTEKRKVASTPIPKKNPLTVYEALDIMDQLYPTFYKRNLWMPSDSTGTINLAYMNINQIQPGPLIRSFVKVDQYSGEILDLDRPNAKPMGTQFLNNYKYPIHFGEIGGLATRILAFFASLMPLFLTVTGMLIWWKPNWLKSIRRRKRRKHKSQRVSKISGDIESSLNRNVPSKSNAEELVNSE